MARPEIPESLNDRAADIWEPLLVLADLAGGEWPKHAREAAEGISAASQEHNPSAALLFDLLVLFGTRKADRLFSRTIVMELNMMPDRPWAEMNRGRAIDENWLAQKLRPYGVRPRTVRIGERMAKGYVGLELRDVFRRYIPRSEVYAGMERMGIAEKAEV